MNGKTSDSTDINKCSPVCGCVEWFTCWTVFLPLWLLRVFQLVDLMKLRMPELLHVKKKKGSDEKNKGECRNVISTVRCAGVSPLDGDSGSALVSTWKPLEETEDCGNDLICRQNTDV